MLILFEALIDMFLLAYVSLAFRWYVSEVLLIVFIVVSQLIYDHTTEFPLSLFKGT